MAPIVPLNIRFEVKLDDITKDKLLSVIESIQNIVDVFGGDTVRIPTLGSIVHYRGKEGVQAMRAAIVSCTLEELDNQNVIDGHISDLDTEMHVHLHVITPGTRGHFEEFNVPHGDPQENGQIPPGTWCWPKMV